MLTSSQSAIIRKTAQGAFYSGLGAPTAGVNMRPYITTFNTSGKDLDVGWFGAIPAVTEFTGDVQYKALNAYTDTITPKEWEIGVAFDEKTFEDDATGTAAMAANALVQKANDHVNLRATAFLEAGIAGTLDTAFDGQFFYDGDHYGVTDAAHDNDLTGAAATGTSPTAAEMETGVVAMLSAMAGFVDDQLYPWPYDPSMIDIMVPTEFIGAGAVTLGPNGSLGTPGGQRVFNQDSGVTGVATRSWFANPHLANADSIYALKRAGNGSVGPLVLNLRRGWEFRQFDSSNDSRCAEQRIVKFMAYARYEIGYGAWQDSCVYIYS